MGLFGGLGVGGLGVLGLVDERLGIHVTNC